MTAEKVLTKRQFDKLCEKYEPIYFSDEVNAKGKHWSIWCFKEVSREYHKLENK